jgi:hypothetical protein
LDSKPKIKAITTKTSKWNYIKLKCFLPSKENNQYNKRPPDEWKKIFANHIFDKGLKSEVFK